MLWTQWVCKCFELEKIIKLKEGITGPKVCLVQSKVPILVPGAVRWDEGVGYSNIECN